MFDKRNGLLKDCTFKESPRPSNSVQTGVVVRVRGVLALSVFATDDVLCKTGPWHSISYRFEQNRLPSQMKWHNPDCWWNTPENESYIISLSYVNELNPMFLTLM